RPRRDPARGRAAARGRRSPRPDLAARGLEGRAPRAGAGARGDLDEAAGWPHHCTGLLRDGARPGLRARRAGAGGRLLRRAGRAHRPAARAGGAGAGAMKLLHILRFELAYQARRPWPWLAMAVLTAFAMAVTRVGMLPVTLPQDFILNSPFIITTVTVLSC